MKCLVKNMLSGPFVGEDFTLQFKEEKKVDFTERVRYYVAVGYIKLKDLYTEIEKPKKITKD